MMIPAVLLVLAIGGMMTGSLMTVGMLASRGMRLQEQRSLSRWAVEEGLAVAMHRGLQTRLVSGALGESERVVHHTARGERVLVDWQRTHPLIVRLTVASGGAGSELWLWLAAPPLALTEAVSRVLAEAVDAGAIGVPSQVAVVTTRARETSRVAIRPSGRAFALFAGAATDFTTGPSSKFTGLAVLDGPLEIRAAMTIRGLLLIRGTVRCAGGTMHLRGALVLIDSVANQGESPACVAAHFDRQALEEALALIAVPQRGPFHLRHWGASSSR